MKLPSPVRSGCHGPAPGASVPFGPNESLLHFREEPPQLATLGLRSASEREQAALKANAGPYHQIVKWCNRGASMHTRDVNGKPIREYDCDEARAEYEKIQKRLAQLDTYLDTGLAEECRRAGCLPGWIR